MARRHSLLLLSFFLSASSLLTQAEEEASGITVTVFLDSGCPIARHHTKTLRELHETYSKQAVSFKAYVPNKLATQKKADAYAKKFRLPFAVTADASQERAKAFGARFVPEVFVHSKGELIYRGRIDDSFAAIGRKRGVTQHHDLRDTLAALCAGETVSKRETPVVGCPITFTKKPPPQS